MPKLTGNVVFANQVNVVNFNSPVMIELRYRIGIAGADHMLNHGIATDTVA
jgi:hypothetical protein